MIFIINKEVETVQNIQSCLFSFKQLNCDFINYRDTSGTHTCVSLRVSVFDIRYHLIQYSRGNGCL